MSHLLFRSDRPDPRRAGLALEVNPEMAGWRLLSFAARQLKKGQQWQDETGGSEVCLVLQSGCFAISWCSGSQQHLVGPRKSVFNSYPHAVYLPPETSFRLTALEGCQIAEGRVEARQALHPRLIRPQDCGYEIRGGGNASRQIVDILPPDFPGDRLLACEVYTPSGNWSSYPPHKHDQDRPPQEVQLEEVYYYRFAAQEAYGFQRVYCQDGSMDETIRVEDGDLVLIPRGYHPFVTAYGYDAYYLNFLAGDRRSMASFDDPRYASFKQSWPPPDPRLPLVPRPNGKPG